MKTSLPFLSVFLLLAVMSFLSGCDKTEKINKEEYDKVLAQRDSCENELTTLSGYLNEISTCVDSVSIQEGVLLNVVNVETGERYSKSEIKERIKELGSIIERQKAKLAELNERLSKDNNNSERIASLTSMITILQTQLEEKEAQIIMLNQQLESSKQTIISLTSNVETLTTNNQALTSENKQLDNIVADQTEKMNEAYFLAADKKKLESMGLLKGGFLKKDKFMADNISVGELTKIDKRKFHEVRLKSKKKPELLTQAPSGSYTFEKEENGEYLFAILDSHAFWSLSNIVIIKLN